MPSLFINEGQSQLTYQQNLQAVLFFESKSILLAMEFRKEYKNSNNT
jgi:hypothetical protein